MSGFQEQLDKEMNDRGLVEATEKTKTKKVSLFSFSAFLKGIAVCSLFSLGILGWTAFKAETTTNLLIEKLASKTAIVERDSSEVYRLSETQPVLTMPDVDLTNKEPKEDNNNAQQTKPDEEKTTDIKPLSVAIDSKQGLVAAPIPGLYEAATQGLLPAIRQEDKVTPFEAYKRPFQKNGDKPLLSIVFFDAGLSRKMAEGLIQNFPPEVSFSFSPYASDLKLLTEVARQAGHEAWLTLPLETTNYPLDDPGPSTLLVNASVEQNKQRLTSILASTQGYVGFVSQKNHVFKREDANVNPSIQEIFDRGLAILDSNPSLYSFVGDLASKNDYPNAKNNFWLDDDLTPLALNQKIRQMIDYGQSGGSIIVMLRPYPASIKALQKFLNSSAAETFQLAPASAQVKYGE